MRSHQVRNRKATYPQSRPRRPPDPKPASFAATQQGERRERGVQRRLPVGSAGDVEDRARQRGDADRPGAVRARPARVAARVPLAPAEDAVGQRIHGVPRVDRVPGEPGGHDRPPTQRVGDQNRGRTSTDRLDEGDEPERDDRGDQGRILLCTPSRPRRAGRVPPSTAPEALRRRPGPGTVPRPAPRGRRRAALRRRARPRAGTPTGSSGRGSPRARPPAATPIAGPSTR